MLRSIFSPLLFPLLFLPLIYSRYDDEYDDEERRPSPVYSCHAYQIAPLGETWTDVIRDSHNESCINNNCMLLWGITTENTVRIIAQGCSKGEALHKPARDTRPMQNECPSGMTIAPQRTPILIGEDGAEVLRSLAHLQICLCQSDWCNAPPKKDGESCEGDDSPFCNPLSAIRDAATASNYSIEAISVLFPPTTASPEESTPDTEELPEEWTYTYLPLLIILIIIIIGSVIALLIAFLWKYLSASKPDQIRHTSGRLNSIAQVTILTEVAQGYKQEGEELIRDCHAGGDHQIANWKYEETVKLGTGSFGAVYKVEMKQDYLVDKYKVAALKTFSHMRSTHFFNESRTLRYVHDFKKHPNIIDYLGRAVDCRDTLEEATWRIALEYCEGGCLRDWITSTRITLTQYLEAASGLLSALSYLHSEENAQTSFMSFRGNSTDSGNPDSRSNSRSRRPSKQAAGSFKKKFRIAHCDINSRNILVRHPITGSVALADFGLALTDREKRQEDVQIREIGTIRYLSPEMLQSLINLSDAIGSLILADTYATGLVLWELLSRTVELYNDDSDVPVYSPPYEKELSEMEGATANRFEAMINVVVRGEKRPSWGGKWEELRDREESAMSLDDDSDLTDEERFLHSSIVGINSMLAKDPEARLTVPSMAEKVDSYRLKRRRNQERRPRSREDSLLEDETSGSN